MCKICVIHLNALFGAGYSNLTFFILVHKPYISMNPSTNEYTYNTIHTYSKAIVIDHTLHFTLQCDKEYYYILDHFYIASYFVIFC